jgi:glycosyltransferase involved in cell wall biosynthesis
MVGNVTSRLKNHEFFIRTAIHFKANPGVRFHIYGALPADSDSYYTYLKNVIHQNDLVEKVFFMAHQASETIMTNIDILFHPAGHESFGRIFIEAMAGGIPIVAVDDGGAVEIVRAGINGFRVPENDSSAAAGCIKKLLDSSELRNKFGGQGREIVEREYSLKLLTERMVVLYKQATSDL